MFPRPPRGGISITSPSPTHTTHTCSFPLQCQLRYAHLSMGMHACVPWESMWIHMCIAMHVCLHLLCHVWPVYSSISTCACNHHLLDTIAAHVHTLHTGSGLPQCPVNHLVIHECTSHVHAVCVCTQQMEGIPEPPTVSYYLCRKRGRRWMTWEVLQWLWVI